MELHNIAIGPTLNVLHARVQLVAGSRAVRAFGAALVFVVATLAVYLTFSQCDCIERQYDDAYITFRYAHNLATGKGLVFNPGDPTDSASSFLYTVLLAGFELLGFSNLPRVAAIIGLASAGVIASLVYLASLERTHRPFLALCLGVIVALHGLISGWAVSGMETTFYSALVLAVLYRVFVVGAFAWSEAALIFAVLLTRFEGVLLAAAWGLWGACLFVKAQRARRLQLLKYAAAVGSGFAAFLSIKFALYGTIIPHAFALKTITALYAPSPSALWEVWRADAPGFLALAVFGLTTLPRSARSAVLVLYVLASAVSLVKGPFADYARYSVHMLPIAAILASVPLSQLSHRYAPIAAALLALLAYDSVSSLQGRRDAVAWGAGHEKCRTEVGQYLERSLPAGTLALSSDIGVIAYAAPSIHFVDTVGLTSKDVLQARMDGQNADQVLFERRPVYLADTCKGSCAKPDEFSANNWLTNEGYWNTPLPRQEYSAHLTHGQMLYRCRSVDGLTFGVAKFQLE